MRAIRSLIGFTLLLCALAPPAHAADVVRIYKVQHRTAEELLPLARTAMARAGSVEADRGSNTLLLSGSSEGVAAALLLLAQVDRRPRSVVLRYESSRLQELADQGIRVDWAGAAGPLRVGTLAFPGKGAEAGIRGAADLGARESDLAGEVRILEGGSGRLLTGLSVPLTTQGVSAGEPGLPVHRATTFVSAGSGFEAQPRILGDGRIQLELRSIDAELRAGERVASSTSATTLLLEPGKTVVLGGLSRDVDAGNARLAAAAGSSQRRDERLLLLTATVE
ncbi:MAG TPA: hypothetical protein DEP35_14260 [Deltaproteobacteria bacterium]|nr:hypothetical protein [Deltaproteobacteria bacterium]